MAQKHPPAARSLPLLALVFAALGALGCSSGQADAPSTADAGGHTECDGCVDGDGVCQRGSSNLACGLGGSSCTACESDEFCGVTGECRILANDTCGADTCDGCCDGEVCLGGKETLACGTDGNSCQTCGSHGVCENGGCMLDPESRWNIVALSGTVNPKNEKNEPWDPSGNPDPFVVFSLADGTRGDSGEDSESLEPQWNSTALENVKAEVIFAPIEISIYDNDRNDDDFMGACTVVLTLQDFDDGFVELDCARDLAKGRTGWTVIFGLEPL